MKRQTFYITTPIYYVTAAPHLGSLYSTIIADVAARWHRLCGNDVFMLTGTDEHGQKVAQAAEKAGQNPQAFVDSFIQTYKQVWHEYHIAYTDFIRTTDLRHVHAVQQWILHLIDQGDIYKDYYTGWYCMPCETFVTHPDQETHVQPPTCPTCLRPTQAVSEESYFFRLSAYQERLLRFYTEHPDFITPRERAHEIINFVKAGLRDLSISRTTVSWGIPFPGDPKHTVYVWADALNNYITAIGYGQVGKFNEFERWWPANAHVMGKDIVRFHAVYWPAFLMAAGLALPERLVVHGWITVNQQKMSKSFGNVIDPRALLTHYGADQVRYYLMRYMGMNHDGDFNTADLERSITSDLANDLGNLVNRMAKLAAQHQVYEVAAPSVQSDATMQLANKAWNMVEQAQSAMEEFNYHAALAAIWSFIQATNAYFHETRPWELAKKDMHAFREVLSATCHSLYTVAIVLWPFMPHKMEQLLDQLGCSLQPKEEHDMIDALIGQWWHQSFLIKQAAPLFTKFEEKESRAMSEQHEKNAVKESKAAVSIEEFSRVELVVGTIESCTTLAKSDKLYVLQVDFGSYGKRQILSGIRAYFTPEQLLGKQAVFVINLPPRMMMGLESQGMLLCAKSADGSFAFTTISTPVTNGTPLS